MDIWPENWPALTAFISCNTQWRVGQAGITGLDYTAVESVMRMHGIARRDRHDTLERIRVMESTALDILRRQK